MTTAAEEHPYVEYVLASGKYISLKPFEDGKGPMLTAELLMGVEGGIRPTPTLLVSRTDVIEQEGQCELMVIYYLGNRLTGHSNVIHGGLLATLLDESLCRCGFALLPHHVGVTASLKVDYKLPTPADSWILLRSRTTTVESSRKVRVTGEIYKLPDPESFDPEAPLDATACGEVLVVEPIWYESLLGGPPSEVYAQMEAASREAQQINQGGAGAAA